MKKNYSTISFASLLFCMLATFSLSFVSCSDDDEVKYMEEDVILEDNDVHFKYIWAEWYNAPEKRTVNLTDAEATVYYNYLHVHTYETGYIYLNPEGHDLEQYTSGQTFQISGKCEYQYTIRNYEYDIEGNLLGMSSLYNYYDADLKKVELLP